MSNYALDLGLISSKNNIDSTSDEFNIKYDFNEYDKIDSKDRDILRANYNEKATEIKWIKSEKITAMAIMSSLKKIL